MDIGVKEIRKWHTDPPPFGRGWSDIGYHLVIRRDGTREIGRHIDDEGAHVSGYNSKSIGVCLVGGRGDDNKPTANFTKEQYRALAEVLHILKSQYPKAEVVGHRDLNAGKACPSFDAKGWYAHLLHGDEE